MYFLTLEASPKPSHNRYGEVDGAYVSGWVNEPTPELAESAARSAADAHGWDVVALDEIRLVSRNEYIADPERLARFDQASADGLALTFHTWPVGRDEE